MLSWLPPPQLPVSTAHLQRAGGKTLRWDLPGDREPGAAAHLTPREALAKGERAVLGEEKGTWQREGELFE